MHIKSKTGEQQYQKLEKLGEGSYGVVYKAAQVCSGELVAIKKIKLDCTSEGIPQTTLREISILKSLRHDCVIHLKQAGFNENQMYMIFEYIDQDMEAFLNSHAGEAEIAIPIIKRLTYQLFAGIAHLHSHRVLHRDIKPANLLIAENCTLKIADFGLGVTHCIPVQHLSDPNEIVTLNYRAPELLLGARVYTGQIDVWSAGCIVAELYNKTVIFEATEELTQMFTIFNVLGTPNEKSWKGITKLEHYSPSFPRWPRQDLSHIIPRACPKAVDLLVKCFTYRPVERITAKSACLHEYYDGIRDDFAFSKDFMQ